MASSNDRPFIRPYRSSDKDNTLRVFRETADPSVQAEPICTIGSHVWCLPYLTLSPRTCFVLDDGNGKAVGYCIGTPDTADFAQRWKPQYLPTIEWDLRTLPLPEDVGEEHRTRGQAKCDELCDGIYNHPEGLVYSDFAQQLEDYPGHLHINILPSHQKLGFGGRLIGAFLTALEDAGSKGVFLGMVAGNAGAARFYEREGFYRLPHVLDDGASGEKGRTKGDGGGGGTIYYAKDL